MFSRLRYLLFERADISSLVFFRIAFGVIMLWEVKRYFDHDWIYRYWIEPSFHFTYTFFHWVRPWPGDGMYYHFYGLAILSAFIALGFLYRLSATLFFLGFAYTFLLEEARYLNHFYLVTLMSFLLIFAPANQGLSVDVWLWPKIKSRTVARWPLVLLAGQMGIVYFFGGIAKLNADWIRGEPMRSWLAERTDFPVVGPFFAEEWTVYAMSLGGLLLDLLAVPFLLWRRSRAAMFAILVLFHFMNDRLFSIGIFPWFAITATTLFFPPDWARRLYEDVCGMRGTRGRAAVTGAALTAPVALWFNEARALIPVVVGALAGALAAWDSVGRSSEAPGKRTEQKLLSMSPRRQSAITALVLTWFVIQVALPLRHLFIPGNVSWTEEGHRFSWHMKLRDKDAIVQFFARDPETGEEWEIDAMETLQLWQYRKMANRPHMIQLFARHLAATMRDQRRSVEIRVLALASLNGRLPQLLIDPTVDLVREPFPLGAASWIRNLKEEPPAPFSTNHGKPPFSGSYDRLHE